MAQNAGVWGIDIGQCAFKALRCTHADDGTVVADAFDYIEYPKILSQPEADPETQIREALEQFLSRNDLKGYEIALAVPGQSGLAKFFKPPPVEAKKIPEIVKFEARQQIPFPLDDVVWDFQQMGGEEVDGFALETEVGLFAMKRDQVYRAMRPFDESNVELDIIQLAPLSIYNFVTHDIIADKMDPDEYDPDNPPASVVVLSMGTDTTDMIITNGYRMWQRSIPLGGNHFTKQLTKELKLTFAKAEHLKRNVRQAEDPKLVFQAMRPVFNDMVTEVQRSIGYFQGIDRKAKIESMILLGNGAKLPGLQPYLAKSLGYDVSSAEALTKLSGKTVLSAPAFRDNHLSFGVAYGLCLQGLQETTLKTNLVPREIVTDRLVRAKKPWIVAAVASLLLGCTFYLFFQYGKLRQVAEDRVVSNVSWKDASGAVDQASNLSSSYESDHSALVAQLDRTKAIGEELVGNVDRRVSWMELLKTLNDALPRTPGVKPGEIPDVKKLPFSNRQEVHVTRVDSKFFDDVSTWFSTSIKSKYLQQEAGLLSGQPATPTDENSDTAAEEPAGPSGEGWVIALDCYHFFNSERKTEGFTHALNSLVRNLKEGRVVFPVPVQKLQAGVVVRHQATPTKVLPLHIVAISPVTQANPQTSTQEVTGYQMQLEGVAKPIMLPAAAHVPVVFTMKEMGIDYPVIVTNSRINKTFRVPNPNYEPPTTPMTGSGGMGGGMPMMGPMGSGGSGMGAGMGAPALGGGGSGPPGGSGMLGSGGAAGTGATGDEPLEPPYLVVPRYDFRVQFVWTETLLSQRLEAQAKAWETQQQQQPDQATSDGNLAVNMKGGL